jgi:hypothetical protein
MFHFRFLSIVAFLASFPSNDGSAQNHQPGQSSMISETASLGKNGSLPSAVARQRHEASSSVEDKKWFERQACLLRRRI